MPKPSPHPALRLVAFVAAVVVLAAILAPLFFQGGHAAAGWIEARGLGDRAPFAYLHKMAVESPFTRYFNRAVLVATLVLLWPFARWLGLRRGDFLLLRRDDRAWRDLAVGFALAAGLLLAMGAGLCAAELYRLKDEPRVVKALVRATTTAAGVALLEEFVFRGVLFSLLLRSMRQRPALWVLSIVFALVHFLKPPDGLGIDGAGWAAGFRLVAGMGAHFLTPDFLLAEFLVLLGVGVVLGWARLRTGTLWLPIGLHAGWVFGIFLFRGVATGTKAVKTGNHLPWIGDNLRTGLIPLAAIGATALLIRLYLHRRTSTDP